MGSDSTPEEAGVIETLDRGPGRIKRLEIIVFGYMYSVQAKADLMRQLQILIKVEKGRETTGLRTTDQETMGSDYEELHKD